MAKRIEWRDRVARWRASGLTGREFARIEKVREGTLRHWAWELGRERDATPNGAGRPAFVEVLAPVVTRDLEIIVRERLRIRIPVDFDERTLRRALAIVESE